MFSRKDKSAKVKPDTVLNALRQVIDPDLNRDIVALGFVKDIEIDGGDVAFKVELTTPACPVKDQLKAQCVEVVSAVPGVSSVDIEMTANVRRAAGQPEAEGALLAGVRNTIAVASGKGGVGKSTTSVNLALALQQTGASVGVLDADVYGPSMAMMLGIHDRPEISPERKLIPLEGHGLRVVSMAFLNDPQKPVIWRGPMVHGLLQQFLRDVAWGELDYLVVDLPPGTGDAQLSLSQMVSISGAVIVTTPQDVSLLDARKGLQTFRQLKVPVLGIVENMSYFVCPHCDKRTEVFRHGGGRRTSEELGVPFLGEIPLDPDVVLGGDDGIPIMVSHPDSSTAAAYRSFCGEVAACLSRLAEEKKIAHPPIMPGTMEWK